jgi:protein-arginine kinase activator protein McsA
MSTDLGIESIVRQVMKQTVPACDQCGNLRSTMENSAFGSNTCNGQSEEAMSSLARREASQNVALSLRDRKAERSFDVVRAINPQQPIHLVRALG